MIDSAKLDHALRSIQAVIIQARRMAYRGDSHNKIASVLDDADHLFNLLCEKDDNTLKFRDILVAISERYDCIFVLEKFDSM